MIFLTEHRVDEQVRTISEGLGSGRCLVPYPIPNILGINSHLTITA